MCAECSIDADCNDGVFCNGTEICDVNGICQSGTNPCPGQSCDEGSDACAACENDAQCDDGLFCNGEEFCLAGHCISAGDPCDDGVFCNGVEICHSDGTCEELMESECLASGGAYSTDGSICSGDSNHDGLDDVCQPPVPLSTPEGRGAFLVLMGLMGVLSLLGLQVSKAEKSRPGDGGGA